MVLVQSRSRQSATAERGFANMLTTRRVVRSKRVDQHLTKGCYVIFCGLAGQCQARGGFRSHVANGMCRYSLYYSKVYQQQYAMPRTRSSESVSIDIRPKARPDQPGGTNG